MIKRLHLMTDGRNGEETMGRRKPLSKDEVKNSFLFKALANHLKADQDMLLSEIWAPSKDKRRAFTGTMRVDMWHRDSGSCFFCGVNIPLTSRWHADHLLSHSRNGQTVTNNGVVSCVRCNLKKSNKFLQEDM